MSGRLLTTLGGRHKFVNSAVLSPDGKRVATASDDNTAKIYIIDFDDLFKWAETQLPKEIDRKRASRS